VQIKRPEAPQNKDGELKNFYLKADVKKDTLNARVQNNTQLFITFKVDALCEAYVRVNACCTERKNTNNVPEM
jgi:hypothetical protein